MYKATFVKDEKTGVFKQFFKKKEQNFIYKFFHSCYYTILRRLKTLKFFLNKFKDLWNWKTIGRDFALFMGNVFLEGLAINFITFVIFNDSLFFGKFLAYGLVPKLLISYFGKLKNGNDSKLSIKKSNE